MHFVRHFQRMHRVLWRLAPLKRMNNKWSIVPADRVDFQRVLERARILDFFSVYRIEIGKWLSRGQAARNSIQLNVIMTALSKSLQKESRVKKNATKTP